MVLQAIFVVKIVSGFFEMDVFHVLKMSILWFLSLFKLLKEWLSSHIKRESFYPSLIDFFVIKTFLMNIFLLKDKVVKWNTTHFWCKVTANSL